MAEITRASPWPMLTLISWLLKSRYRLPLASQKKTPFARATGMGATSAWTENSKRVCCLQRRTISSAESELVSNTVNSRGLKSCLGLWLVELPGQRFADVPVVLDLAGGDLPQRQDRGLVFRGLNDRSGARHQLPGALGAQEHQSEAVVDQGQAIFDSYTGHRGLLIGLRSPKSRELPNIACEPYLLRVEKRNPNHPGELSAHRNAEANARSTGEINARGEALKLLLDGKLPLMVGGAYAFARYTGIYRDTKDLDLFLRHPDAVAALEILAQHGWRTERTDEVWLYKAYRGEWFVDLLFNSGNGIAPVEEDWFECAPVGEVFGLQVPLLPAEEMIWSKAFVLE